MTFNAKEDAEKIYGMTHLCPFPIPATAFKKVTEQVLIEAHAAGVKEGAMDAIQFACDGINDEWDQAYQRGVNEGLEMAVKVVSEHYWDSLAGSKHGESIVSMVRALKNPKEEQPR